MKIKIRNKLDLLIKDSGIRSFEDMAQRLSDNQGYKIGRTAISRLARNENGSFTVDMIEAICNELNCLPGDIFETTISDADPEFVDVLQSRLQPFRYGAILVNRHASQSEKEKHNSTDHARPATTPEVQSFADDLDFVGGPKVSHMSKDRLKK